MATSAQVVARIDVAVIKSVEHLAIEWGVYRQNAIERLLRESLERYKDTLERVSGGTGSAKEISDNICPA